MRQNEVQSIRAGKNVTQMCAADPMAAIASDLIFTSQFTEASLSLAADGYRVRW
jgi:hypothetical protein